MENPYRRGYSHEGHRFLEFYNIRIFPELLPFIISGAKTLDVRATTPIYDGIVPGTILRYNGVINRMVLRVGEYPNFDEVMAHEDPTKIHPTAPPEVQLAALRRIYSPRQEQQGVLVFELGMMTKK